MIISDISILLVFLAGIVSFFSPCIVPIIPLYLGFLASGLEDDFERNKKIIIRTISFVLGISISFFILGLLFTNLGRFIGEKRTLVTRMSGIIIIIFGMIQIGLLEFKFLNKSRRINLMGRYKNMNTINAFIMGMTFSFAWTPCVGPILSSVLLLASSSKSSLIGNTMVLVYTLGFVIPFILVGFLSSKVYQYISSKGNLLKNISKIGGIIVIIMGIMVYTGWLNNMSSYLSKFSSAESLLTSKSENIQINRKDETEITKSDTELVPIIDFTLTDQYNLEHTLSDYKGKVILLNFWATGCPPCKKEIPLIEKAYMEYDRNQKDLVILTIVNPEGFLEGDKNHILKFINDYEVTFPVLFDYDGVIFDSYSINSIPTSFMINKNSEILGYVPGGMTESMIKSIINESLK